MRCTPSGGAVVDGAEGEELVLPPLRATLLPLPSFELHATKASAARIIAADSETKKRIQLTSSRYSIQAKKARAVSFVLRLGGIARFHGQAGAQPSVITAKQRRRLLYALLSNVMRRTGA
jgi:hypothetical protein